MVQHVIDWLNSTVSIRDLIIVWFGWRLCDFFYAFAQGYCEQRRTWQTLSILKENSNVRVDQTEAKKNPRN